MPEDIDPEPTEAGHEDAGVVAHGEGEEAADPNGVLDSSAALRAGTW